MQVAPQDRGNILAESILGWWNDAGVDYLCDETTVNWLEKPEAPPAEFAEPKRAAAPIASAAAVAVAAPVVQTPRAVWPTDHAALVAAIASDAALPGNGYGPARVAPCAVQNAPLMVLLDFPEEEDLRAGSLGHGAVGNLLHAMLKACGYAPDEISLTALAHSRPASGAIPQQDIALLGDFARHRIGLAKPQRLLLLGSSVSEALTGKELMEARTISPDFNQNGLNLTGAVTFHPRTLLSRALLKAQAWKDLQRIVRKV